MQVFYWLLFTALLVGALFVLVPVHRIKELFVYGLVGGIGMAVVVFLLANYFHLWEIIGGVKVFDIPLLPAIAWFFPTVIFGNYFPKNDHLLSQIGIVVLFAAGSVMAQWVFLQLDMWRNIHWNYLYTFFLALTTHTILSLYIGYTEQYLKEK